MKNNENDKESRPNRIRHEWRNMFSKEDLEKGQSFVNEGKYRDFVTNDHQAEAYIGAGGAYHAIILDSPDRYSIGWDENWLHCSCTKNSGRRSRRSWYYDPFSEHRESCQHLAALMLLWEKKHGPWEFEETEKEKAQRLEEERREKEEQRLQKRISEERRRREAKKKVDGRVSASPLEFYEKHAQDSPESFFDLKAAAKSLKTDRYAYERAEELLLPRGVEESLVGDLDGLHDHVARDDDLDAAVLVFLGHLLDLALEALHLVAHLQGLLGLFEKSGHGVPQGWVVGWFGG